MRQVFTSERLVTPQGIKPGAIVVEGERITAVLNKSEAPASIPVTDFGRAAILPGLVDSHVHINEPGRTEWEGFRTATRAAAASGYTLLVDMPLNCVPATTTAEALEAKREAAKGQCHVDWAAWGGVVADNQNRIAELAAAGVLGFKCFLVHPGIDEFSMVNEAQLCEALPHLTKTGLPLLAHAELPGPIEAASGKLSQSRWREYETYLRSRPDEAELEAIDLLCRLSRETGAHIHIVHLATAKALERLRAAKSEGVQITVETCPHYLHFSAEQIPDGATLFKCAPPIRSRGNREALWQGLGEGVIDMIVTDHSPCPPAMKRLDEDDFRCAWGGIASLSVALRVMWTEARARGFQLTDIARWMAERPARLAGCHPCKGKIAPGCDADLVVFDPEAEFIVTEGLLYYRHPVSPYLGERLRGKVLATFVRGRCVFKDGAFPGAPAGRESIPRSAAVQQN